MSEGKDKLLKMLTGVFGATLVLFFTLTITFAVLWAKKEPADYNVYPINASCYARQTAGLNVDGTVSISQTDKDTTTFTPSLTFTGDNMMMTISSSAMTGNMCPEYTEDSTIYSFGNVKAEQIVTQTVDGGNIKLSGPMTVMGRTLLFSDN